ncbi:hypothetical protein CA600_22780 [Paenibacillus sp. VTT E-133280]|uniref:hypothetical protein n=1 Tax=unclassified Paenibacillus TaxID=185978 RepID=UPI000BA15C2B|nr:MULTISPECIES: hypothetical protein [unclassified Paenibacillus]MBY3621322.1 hypothetical protein [Acinetobacter sp. CUI P1]MDH6373077.1 Fe-S cluster assembly iron-binding protein IscA [Paenibacillus sp. PastF-3]OZQ62257.1 hypothetical protein CA600_22780 [Paenibacillus sp. VTT E-133280]OZQ77756.1 hypothetical protein CA598_29640 [Paenibacillus sp. VTT E-133291]
MKISDSAKVFIENIMKDNEGKILRISQTSSGCCDPNVNLALDDAKIEDHIQTINDIQVVIEPERVTILNNIILDLDEGNLVILNEGSSCC